MDDLTPDVVAFQNSLKIPPAEQARRDAIARQVIASEGEGEDLGVTNIGLARQSERPVSRSDMRLRGSSDIDAPTLSANDYQGSTNEPKQPKLKFVGYDGEEPAPSGKPNLKYIGLDGETPQDKPAAPKLRKAGELKYLGLDSELNPPAETVNQPAQQEGATFGDRAKDLGISLAQGVVAVPEAVVGLANIPTGGAIGKFAEDHGIRFKDTQEILDNWRSDAGKQAQQNFADAEGFYDAGKAAIQNPSVIADGIVKSIPSIGGGSVFGRALIYAFPKLVGAIGAGAVGEGVMSAGSSAESFRQQSETGYTTNEQNALAAATGLSVGLIGKFSGGVSAKLGINDIDNVLINGSADQVEQVVKKSLGRKLAEGGFSEGILEEMPQSAIETLISNVALDRPIMEGVQESAAMGALTGGAMGVGAQLIQPKPALSRGQQIIQKLKAQKGIVEPPIAQAEPQNEMLNASDLLDEPAPDQPTPEPQVTLEAQTQAFIDGTKPAILLTEGEKYPEGLPADVKTAEVEKGILIYRDDATLELAQNGKLGQALGYGIDEKPTGTDQTVTARNADGVVIQDVLTDGSQSVIDAATKVAGADGTVEIRSAEEAIAEREAVKADDDEGQFPPQTQTLGIPRAEMPQIKAVHRGAMVNFLNARGITHQQETVTPESLKPTQAEYSKSKVKKAEEYTGTNRSVLISADNHVLDGHHQWLAKMNNGEDIDVIRLNSPIKDLLETVKEFPSATLSDAGAKTPELTQETAPDLDSKLGVSITSENGKTPETAPVKAAVSPKKATPKKETLLATLRNSGGILLSDKRDVTGEDTKFAPGGYNQVFKKEAKQSLKGQIESGNLDDYLPPAMRLSSASDEAFDSTDAYDYLAERIKNGDSVIPFDVEQEINAQKFFKQQELTAQEVVDILSYELDEESANEQFRIASNEERESAESAGQPAASGTQDTTASGVREPASGEIKPVIQSAPVAKTTSEKTEREGVRALVETIAKNRAASNEINKAKYFNERLQDAKDFMAGKDVKPARFVDAALTFTKYEPIKAAFTELSRMAKEPAKEARKAVTSVIDDYKAKIAAAKSEAELTELGTAVQKDSTLTDAQAIKLDDLIADAQDNLNAPDTKTTQEPAKPTGNTDLLGENTKGRQAIADAERAKDAKRNSGNAETEGFTLTGSNSETDVAKANGAQDLFADNKPADKPTPATKQNSLSTPDDKKQFADNKVFTASAVEKARARLKSKLGNLNSGLDPELLIDGMTIAGAYIESGVRSFSAYAKAMKADFGDSITPYLLSFYESVRAYPGIDKAGMTDSETSEKEHIALLTPSVKIAAKEVIGAGIVETPKVKAKPDGQLTLTQDWGVESINAYESDRDDGKGDTVKSKFLAEGKKYLVQVEKLLETQGFTPHVDSRGRLQKAVSVNEAGIGSSGEVTLTMVKGDVGVYLDLGTAAIRGLTGNHPQAVSLMARVTGDATKDRYANKGQNNWLRTDLNATTLAGKLLNLANNVRISKGNENATADTAGKISADNKTSDLLAEQPRNLDSKPLDNGMARESKPADQQRPVSTSVQEPSGSGTERTGGNNGNESPSGSRKTSDAGNNTSAAASDAFEIGDEVGLGEGTAAKKLRDNINAIKLIKALEAENRTATPDERNQLAKYTGFGALSAVFERNNKDYAELKALLTPEEYESARASILNAYYTSKTLVDAMYNGVAHLGFKGGRVLEPSLGSGNFFGLMPAGLRNKSQLNGVELDSITSRLAKALYPQAKISTSTGFEKYQAPEGYFDLVVGNPPFGSEKITDADKRGYSGFSIHNYFLAKSIDKLRDGGIMSVVVSHSFMDAKNSVAREWIAQRANLVAGIRLPSDAFKANAGTEVITDILYFQKTATPEKNPTWIEALDADGYTFNDYFIINEQNVLGKVKDTTNQFGKTFTVESTGDLAKQLKAITAEMPQNIYVQPTQRVEVLNSADNTVPDGVKVGTFYSDSKGNIRQRLPDQLGDKQSQAWEPANAKAKDRMTGMMDMRDLLRSQMRLERDPMATEKQIEQNREKLNKKYDSFLKEFGYLNSATNRRLFLDDTESALVQALEFDYDQGVTKVKAAATGMDEKEPSATKADIFKRRVLFPPSDSITVNNAKDALLASLDVKGSVDVDYMAELYNKPVAAIVSELGDVIFNDPQKGYVTADEYLSGDVKTKLAEAQHALKSDKSQARNVEALEKVIPKDKLPSEIFASAGANWIPAKYYDQFAAEVTGIPPDGVEFTYVKAAAMWLYEKRKTGDAGKLTSDFGTAKIDSFEMFGLLINGKSPEVKKSTWVDGKPRMETDIEQTDLARAKYQKMKEHWNSWIFSDPDRADELASIYNEKHNRVVSRKFDGSHMNFYGMSPSITLIPSQKDVVWRAIQDRNVLLDHVVGAGKTFAMAASAMEMKRLGIARKPMFVVPNHLTLQWRSEFTRLYPASNILAATPDDFAKDKREKMFSKMVTGGYDAIIIGHSSIKKVGLPADVEQRMYDEQINDISDAIEIAKSERGDRGITRDMEKIKKNLEAKIEKLKEKAGNKDDVVGFDELGVDAMFIDEMHEFKNLFFTTQMQRTSGLGNPAGSGKALDLFMKVRYMQETHGENVPLITATGTPVSNSLAEMYTMQRYMKYDELKRADLHMFDAWAKQYGEVEQVYEVAPSGVGYRQSTRFSKFKNLPSLMGSYTGFADIITLQDLKDQAKAAGKVFPVPKLKSGKPMNVVAQRSILQRDFFGIPQLAEDEQGNIKFELNPMTSAIEKNNDGKFVLKFDGGFSLHETQEEAELELVTKSLTPQTFIDPKSLLGQFADLARLTRETKGKINALSLTSLANKAGLDYRIIDPSAPDHPDSKINMAVNNAVELWQETTKDKGTQLVFCDMSIPNSARGDMSSKERRIYVRDRNGLITHKAKGVVYAAQGFEGFPFYITKERGGFVVYEALTGLSMRDFGLDSKDAAKEWVNRHIEISGNRDRIYGMRDTRAIDSTDVDEYRDAQELEVAEDGSNEIGMADLEALAGSSRFSVYDDMKAKLVARGVPEVQIAFIHDYGTPKQKDELFKRVNRGDVRFLFGSTPKLGAGTNVQKRLVGLHHIDAPWRPSDLEQREGRIIRQGNELYQRDPDGFEISIWRYATEQTYDTRRWQLLEHKAAGIEQLRKYSGEAEIEDVASEASNSADMKAAASGNPLILEETKLRTEVKRLVNMERGFADSKYSMARKIKSNDRDIAEYWPNKIDEYQSFIDATKAFPIPDDKTKIATIVVDGEKLANREKAENAIGLLATKVRQSFEANNTKEVVYRGVPFTFRRGFNIGTLMLESPDGMMHTYFEKDSLSPSGLITRLNNYIDSFSARIDNIKAAMAKAKLENEQLKPRLNEPFEDVQLLKDTQAKHASVQRRLMKSSQLEAVPESQITEFKKILKERKANLVSMGFDKAIKESEKDGDADFSQGSGKGNLLVDEIKAAIKADTFGQEIDIYPSLMDAPVDIQRQVYSEGAAGVEGFFDRSTNRVALIASNIKSLERAREVARHELIGHYGIENMLNDEDPALFKKLVNRVQFSEKNGNKIIVDIGKQVDATRNQELSPARRAREIIAVMAERNLQNSIVKRVLDSIRRFLNKYTKLKLDVTDAEVAELLRYAQKYLKKQGRSIASGTGTEFSQVDQTSTPNFKKWFGDSKVVDDDGKPLVVYHGTQAEFEAFDKEKDVLNRGFWFSTASVANRFAMAERGKESGDNVIPAYLSIKQPYVYDANALNRPKSLAIVFEEAKAGNYDGVYMKSLSGKADTYVAFEPNQIKSAIGNNGNFDPNSDRIDFSQSAPRQGRLTPQWNSLEASKMDSVLYTLQDKSIDLKRVTQAIKKAGNDISDRWNAYLQEELYHGRTAKRTQDFIKNDLEPLIEAMRLRGVTMADFEEYLWARHAEERNIQIAKVNPDMPDGGSGMKTADAQAYMDGLTADQKDAYQSLAKRIDTINAKSRQVLVDYGLESTATIAAWNAAYKNYVPLMREDMDAGFGNGTGSGFSVKGNSSKRATGSNRAVVDIIANIAQQFEKNLIRGEKNRVSTALIGLAKLNPNEGFWSVDTPPTIKTIGKVSGLVEVHTDPNYKNRDNVVVARIPDKLGRIQERAVVFNQFDERAMRMSKSIKNLDQDQIGEILGAAASVTRWFAAVNTQYNPIFGVINILRDVQGSMLNLSSTPLKGKKSAVLKGTLPAMAGIYKDLRSVRAGKGAAKSQWALLFEEFEDEGGQTGYRDLFRNAEARAESLKKTLDPTWWQETKAGKFLTAGGLLAKPEQWILEKSQEWIFNWLTDYNTALENAVRLSVYKTAKDSGLSKQQSASLAKNISVNFNRKGAIGRQAGALYAFFNASIQGTARISETLFKNDNGKISLSAAGLKIISGGLLLGVMQAFALAMAGYDDDEPPEFVKDKNIVVPLDMFGADGKYISLAMPLGFNAIPAFGRIVTEWAMDGFSNTPKRLTHVLGMLMDVTNPIGNAGLSLQTITPTVLDPFTALAENKDFTGRNIAQEDFNSLKPTPGHSRAKDTATVFGKGLSHALNALTGGNEYVKGAFSPTPDQIDYLIGQVFGGVGREIMKTEQTLTSAVTGEDLPVYKIPLVGRFGGNAKSNSAEKGAYYKNIIHMNEVEAELKGRIATKDDVADFKADNPEHKLIGVANAAETNIAKLKKRRKALIDSGAAQERVKMVDELIVVNMKKLNERINAAEK